MTPTAFRKRPITIHAMQIPRLANMDHAFMAWVKQHSDGRSVEYYPDNTLMISTLEGKMVAKPGNWLIIGVKGELYPCRDDIFHETYEAVQ